MLKSAIILQKLREDLEKAGFVENSYDPHIAHKIVDGSQIMVTWHVDDVKLAHKNG